MKKFIAAGLTVAALAVPAQAGAQEDVPYLSAYDAEIAMEKVLKPKFGEWAIYGARCGKAPARNVRKCKLDWYVGDVSYAGRGRVEAHPDRDFGSLVWMKVRWQVRETDHYCKAVKGTKHSTGKDCVKTKGGRARIAY